jgi:hypothetical protein
MKAAGSKFDVASAFKNSATVGIHQNVRMLFASALDKFAKNQQYGLCWHGLLWVWK